MGHKPDSYMPIPGDTLPRFAGIEVARQVVGDDKTYVSFDVDALDPVYAPGTGTPEIGGINTYDPKKLFRAGIFRSGHAQRARSARMPQHHWHHRIFT